VTTGSTPPAAPQPFTLRAILAGSIGALILSLGAPYAIHLIRGSYMALDFSTPGAVFLFFVLTFIVNRVLRRLRREWALNPGELIIAYIMMIVASAICTMGLTSQLLPIITAPRYYGPENAGWTKHLLPLLDRRPWLTPTTAEAIRYFYEGLPRGRHIPWGAWAAPLAAWLPFMCVLYLVMIAMMVIIRKQWVERERLAFPVTQLPLEMARGADAPGGAPFFRNAVMWSGFAIPFILGSLKGLHYYYPVVPVIAQSASYPWFREPLIFVVYLSFPLLGFFYLVNTETLFGLWFFNIVFQVIAGLIVMFGATWQENLGIYGSPSPWFAHLGMGAMIALVALGLWSARAHLRDVVRKALRGDPAVDDSGEVMSYRAAFWSVVGGLGFMWVWLWLTGLPVTLAVIFLAGAFVLFYGLARVVMESGLAVAVASTISSGFVVSSFGSKAVGGPGLVSLAINYVWSSDIRTYVMASSAHALRMADMTARRKRPLFWIIWLAIFISIAASIWVTMVLAYAKGGVNLNQWFFIDGPRAPYNWIVDKLATPTDPNWPGWLVRAGGFAVMSFLMFMRTRFVWWPFHPIGFAVGSTWIMNVLFATCLAAWVLKSLIIRYGGLRGYMFLRPAFLGFILGQYTCNAVWLIIDAMTGATNNVIGWI